MSMNLMTDDPDSLHKKKRHMKWDAKSKKYVVHEVGSDGRANKLRNESGAKINFKKKQPDMY